LVTRKPSNPRATIPAIPRPEKEPLLEQIASFIGFFVYLLILKTYFLPLFVIPTGSMAETLYGAHSAHTCPNCGFEYPVGWSGDPPGPPPVAQCPNCHWQEYCGLAPVPALVKRNLPQIDATLHDPLRQRAGDRIMVHGWPYDLGGPFAPQRWDVVVFKVPWDGDTNYIKRLIGRPGETIEIIDGDIFVADPQTNETRIARKTATAQESLWFPYYNQDFPPRQPGSQATYHPRWVAREPNGGWTSLETRRPRFDGLNSQSGQIVFVTDPGQSHAPGVITDVYGYDGPYTMGNPPHVVNDVRLGCEVTLEAGGDDGFVELSTTKHADHFFARLYRNGRVTLEHATSDSSQREPWGEARIPLPAGAVRLALSNVDYVVSVEIDGRPVVQSSLAQYNVTAEQARALSRNLTSPHLAVAAQNVRLSLAHLLIERDVCYTSDVSIKNDGQPGYGTQGHPIVLGQNECFVLGDNSPNSLDCRFAFAQQGTDPVGPHLKAAEARGEFHKGTVPVDQLLGPAFLVYWPGTDALLPDDKLPDKLRVLNQLPGPGRIRWIR
jgi:signal peptidase I